MKDGIHLGPPKVPFPWFGTVLLVAGSTTALLLLLLSWSVYRDVRQLRAEVGASSIATATSSAERLDRDRAVRSRLQSVLDSGLLAGVAPTDVLRLLEEALPEGVSLRHLSLDATPPNPGLTLEALARDETAVSELQRRMAGAPMVSATTLLEERRSAEGALVVRLHVDLLGPRTP